MLFDAGIKMSVRKSVCRSPILDPHLHRHYCCLVSTLCSSQEALAMRRQRSLLQRTTLNGGSHHRKRAKEFEKMQGQFAS